MAKTDVVEAQDIIEDVVELVEDTSELVGRNMSWLSNPKALLVTASLTGVVLGSVATYLIASKKLSSKWQKIADEEIQDVKNFYAITRKSEEEPSLADLAAAYDESEEEARALAEVNKVVEREGYTPYSKVRPAVEAVEQVSQNVFATDVSVPDFDLDVEIAAREKLDEGIPFVISLEEYNDDEGDFDKDQQLTYYDGDGVLVDEHDSLIEDIDGMVGQLNMNNRFGHGSGDPNVVYVRNLRLRSDIEIVRSHGKYSVEVLGADYDEEVIQHSGRPRKFRLADE